MFVSLSYNINNLHHASTLMKKFTILAFSSMDVATVALFVVRAVNILENVRPLAALTHAYITLTPAAKRQTLGPILQLN